MPYVRYLSKDHAKENAGFFSPGPAKYQTPQSTLGRHPVVHSSPIHSFGSADRFEPRRFLSSDHARHSWEGKMSPGPSYTARSAIGAVQHSTQQVSSAWSFGKGRRDEPTQFISKQHATQEKAGQASPGPMYPARSTFGDQEASQNRTNPSFSVGGESRFNNSTYLGKLHEKKMEGVNSPGPQYKANSSFGRLPNVHQEPCYGFGTAERDKSEKARFISKAHATADLPKFNPGPGTNNVVPSMGTQGESARPTAPSFSFGVAERVGQGQGPPSPGPVYVRKGAVGLQEESMKTTMPSWSIGHAPRGEPSRFVSRQHASAEKVGMNSPGPMYAMKSTFGEQDEALHRTYPSFSVPGSGRFQKVEYLGKGFDKDMYGEGSPGPQYGAQAMLGRIANKNTAPAFSFTGREKEKAPIINS